MKGMTWVVGLFLTSASSAATVENKFFVCHFENGAWKKIVATESEANVHLTQHDDAFPGWKTVLSGTQLDRDCKPVAALESYE